MRLLSLGTVILSEENFVLGLIAWPGLDKVNPPEQRVMQTG